MSDPRSAAAIGSGKHGSIDGSSHGGASAGSTGPSSGHDPQFTSRVSIKHVVEVIQGFIEYKEWLVQEIGFGGILKIPLIQKVSLKFSAWTMSKVDVVRQAICIREDKVLKFWAEDLHKMFGVLCGNRDVKGRDGNITQESIEFIKKSIGLDRSGDHSLRAVEEFLKRDESSKIEKDCFQIAFVIFVMGHLLAPSTKYDYCQIDFWGAVANTENIAQFNWCEYVLQCLLDAVVKLQKDMANGNSTINLSGCHVFLPVTLFDFLWIITYMLIELMPLIHMPALTLYFLSFFVGLPHSTDFLVGQSRPGAVQHET
jgi:hypothetical protein